MYKNNHKELFSLIVFHTHTMFQNVRTPKMKLQRHTMQIKAVKHEKVEIQFTQNWVPTTNKPL